MLPDFSCAIFDLDGTLLDSMSLWAQIDIDFLTRRGIPVPEDYTARMTKLSYADGAAYTISRFGLSETPEELIAEWDAMSIAAYRDTILLKDGVQEYLFTLKEKGVRMGIATALSPACCEPVLRRNGIDSCFDAFAFVQEVARGKGFPDIYLLASERLGASPAECVVFEDILPGIQGAKAGGFYTCGVADAHAAKEREDIRREADHFIESFRELL